MRSDWVKYVEKKDVESIPLAFKDKKKKKKRIERVTESGLLRSLGRSNKSREINERIIFSIEHPKDPKATRELIYLLKKRLLKNEIFAEPCEGGYQYEGGEHTKEISLFCYITNQVQKEIICELAREYKQESILCIQKDDHTHIYSVKKNLAP